MPTVNLPAGVAAILDAIAKNAVEGVLSRDSDYGTHHYHAYFVRYGRYARDVVAYFNDEVRRLTDGQYSAFPVTQDSIAYPRPKGLGFILAVAPTGEGAESAKTKFLYMGSGGGSVYYCERAE